MTISRTLFSLLFVGAALFAQKAYELETFSGSSKEFEVTFKFAVGMGDASEASLLERQTGRRTAFRYDFDAPFGKMELVPDNGEKGMRIEVAVDPNDINNHKSLKCKVHSLGKEHPLTLKRVGN
jgi:hypothetical protein